MDILTKYTQTRDLLRVQSYPTRPEMGAAAAAYVGSRLRSLLQGQETVTIAFASAPSQSEFLAALVQNEGIDWTHVTAFGLDEYVGITPDHPASFGDWLDRHIYRQVPFACIHYWQPQAADPQAECDRYQDLLRAAPLDMACIGIGENGHLAFNEPYVSDLYTPRATTLIQLDETSRQQQVNDGCFSQISEVPYMAMTMTLPMIMSAKVICVVAPGATKAGAVKAALEDPISSACPASILRQHPDAVLYLDRDSFPKN